jgi:transcriptional regulator with XRE-family HTH domain
MAKPTVALREHVGAALKRAREARGWSVSELGRVSGIAKATLSALEAGKANPTLETLWAISGPLGLSVGELLEPAEPTLAIVRAGEGTTVRGDSVSARLLQAFETGGVRLELYEADVANRRQVSPAHARGVTEHIVVTAGRLRVGPVDAPVELGPGDSLRMAPRWPHLYQGLARGTKMVLVMAYPRG